MQISGREAAFRLEVSGLTNRRARQLLRSGLAGNPDVTRAVTWFDDVLVDALTTWPFADEAAVDAACPAGLFIARREISWGASCSDQLSAASSAWLFSPWTAFWLRMRIAEHGCMPFVATTAGFVTIGAEITGVHEGAERALVLREPGSWFDLLARHRIEAGQGRPWAIRGWQPEARVVGQSGRQLRPRRPAG